MTMTPSSSSRGGRQRVSWGRRSCEYSPSIWSAVKSICGEGNTGMRPESAKGFQREAEVASTTVGGRDLSQVTSVGWGRQWAEPQSPDE